MSRKKNIILHPFLLSVVPILFLYDFNKHELSLKVIVFPLVINLGGAIIILMLLKVLVKNLSYAALITSLAVTLNFSYETVLWQSDNYGLKEFLLQNKKLIWIYGVTLLAIIFRLRKEKADLSPLTTFLNSFSIIMVFYIGFNITLYQIKTFNLTPMDFNQNPILSGKKRENINILPDIYYIILDAHGREDILKTFAGCDISPFISSLEEKGFFVAKKSRSNYRMTPPSLGSSLNLDYIQNIQLQLKSKQESTSRIPYYRLIENNKVVKYLKAKGYKYIHFNSNIRVTETNENADIYINFDRFNNKFFQLLMNTTVIGSFDLEWTNVNERHRKALIYNFHHLREIYKIKGPKFVFAHFLMPHVPYVFDGAGNPQPDNIANDTYNKNAYCKFSIFGDKKIDQAVTQIISQSETPPVIIVQGDHGTGFVGNMQEPPPFEIIQVFANLNAYYVPNNLKAKLYDTISPVNSFRLIFNHYFGTKFELLEDRTLFCWDCSYLRFVEVPREMDLHSKVLPEINYVPMWIKSLEETIKIDPDYPEALNTIGLLYLVKLKQYKKSLPYFKKAIKLSPKRHFIYRNAGDAFMSLKRYPEAVDMYRKAIKFLPNSWNYNFKLGIALKNTGRREEESLKFLKKAMQLQKRIYRTKK